jgi:hypothetical protein
MALSRGELRQLALAGAKTRLQELDTERRTLLQAFPELGAKPPRIGARRAEQPRKRTMTASQRRAVSRRMKALWAERRKAKGKAA